MCDDIIQVSQWLKGCQILECIGEGIGDKFFSQQLAAEKDVAYGTITDA